MDAHSQRPGAVMVCTAGNPTLVVTSLLARLVEDGADLRYRGDFDWPGVAIANRVVTDFGAVPWRMSQLGRARGPRWLGRVGDWLTFRRSKGAPSKQSGTQNSPRP